MKNIQATGLFQIGIDRNNKNQEDHKITFFDDDDYVVSITLTPDMSQQLRDVLGQAIRSTETTADINLAVEAINETFPGTEVVTSFPCGVCAEGGEDAVKQGLPHAWGACSRHYSERFLEGLSS